MQILRRHKLAALNLWGKIRRPKLRATCMLAGRVRSTLFAQDRKCRGIETDETHRAMHGRMAH